MNRPSDGPADGLSELELAEAHAWWESLPETFKAKCSVWTILALYARHWAKSHTVAFDEEPPSQPTPEKEIPP